MCVLHAHSFKAPSQHNTHTHTLFFVVWVSRVEENTTSFQGPFLTPFFPSVCLFMNFTPMKSGLPLCKGCSVLYFISVPYFAIENVLLLAIPYMILSAVLEIGTDAPLQQGKWSPRGEKGLPLVTQAVAGLGLEGRCSHLQLPIAKPCGPLAGSDI